MPDADEIKTSLYTTALEYHRDEYDRFIDIWKGLDTKAQGTVTIAGIFIAGVFAFIKDIRTLALDGRGRCVLILAIVCLVLSVVLSILVLTLRKVESPPSADLISQIVGDIVRVNETIAQNDAALPKQNWKFINEQARLWSGVLAKADKAIKLKYLSLLIAQWLLVAAIVFVVGLTFLILGRS